MRAIDRILTRDEAKFMDYLEETLIPDLEEAGHEFTAEDFKRCVWLIQKLLAKIIRLQE